MDRLDSSNTRQSRRQRDLRDRFFQSGGRLRVVDIQISLVREFNQQIRGKCGYRDTTISHIELLGYIPAQVRENS